MAEQNLTAVNLAKAAKCYKWFIWIFITAIVFYIVLQPKAGNIYSIFVFAIYSVLCFKWSDALGKNKWMWGILGFIPLINVISMLVLANQTQKIIKANGQQLGFFGGIKT